MDVIVGYGLAGACLVAAMPDRAWTLVDPVAPADDRRTFGCWARGPHPLDAVARRGWRRLGIATDRVHVVPIAPYRYLSFAIGDWREWALARARHATVVAAAAERVEDSPYGARVWTRDGSIAARWVFDARFAPSAIAPAPGEVLLWQSFHGARIETDDDRFDPDLPLWMDFRGPPCPDGVAFGHVLPDGPRAALVHRVQIADRPVRVDLDGYLRDGLGLSRWRAGPVEGGATPMTDHPFPRRIGDRALAVGIAGGRLKPSTGYGVGRMLRDAEHVRASLVARGHPFDLPADPWRFRVLDAAFLRALRAVPARAPEIFGRLFTRNPGPRVLRFLDEEAGIAEILRLGLTLPPGPLLR